MTGLGSTNPHSLLYTLIRGLLRLAVDDVLSNDAACSIALDNLIQQNDGLLHQIVEKKWIVDAKRVDKEALADTGEGTPQNCDEMIHLPHVLRRVLQLLCLRSHIRQDVRSLSYNRNQLEHLVSPTFGVSLRNVASILRAEKEIPATVRRWSATFLAEFIEKYAWFWNNGANHNDFSSQRAGLSSTSEGYKEEECKQQEYFLQTTFEPQLTSILGSIAISYIITSDRSMDYHEKQSREDLQSSGSTMLRKCIQLYQSLLQEMIKIISKRLSVEENRGRSKEVKRTSANEKNASSFCDTQTGRVTESRQRDEKFSTPLSSPVTPRRRILHTISPPIDILAEEFGISGRRSQGSEEGKTARASITHDSFTVNTSTDELATPIASRNIIPPPAFSSFPTPPHGQAEKMLGDSRSKKHWKRQRKQPIVFLGLAEEEEEEALDDNGTGYVDPSSKTADDGFVARYYTLQGKTRRFEPVGGSDGS